MGAVANMAVTVTAKTRDYERGMNRAKRATRGFSKGAKKASFTTRLFRSQLKAFGAMAGGAAVVGGLMRGVRAMNSFDQAMKSSLAIMGDVSDAMRDKMARSAIEMAGRTKFSAAEAAKSYYYLASAGLNAKQSLAEIGRAHV